MYINASIWNKLPTKLRCEINYNIFRRKVKLFLLY